MQHYNFVRSLFNLNRLDSVLQTKNFTAKLKITVHLYQECETIVKYLIMLNEKSLISNLPSTMC